MHGTDIDAMVDETTEPVIEKGSKSDKVRGVREDKEKEAQVGVEAPEATQDQTNPKLQLSRDKKGVTHRNPKSQNKTVQIRRSVLAPDSLPHRRGKTAAASLLDTKELPSSASTPAKNSDELSESDLVDYSDTESL